MTMSGIGKGNSGNRLRSAYLPLSLSTTCLVVVFLAVAMRQSLVVSTLHLIDDIFGYVTRKTTTITEKRYLSNNFAPMTEPLSTTELTVVSGSIPATLSGTYIRNGANIMYYPPRSAHHMFDGESFPHRIRFENGKAVRYDRSWLDSPRWKALHEYGREAFPSVGDIIRGGFHLNTKIRLFKMRKQLGLVPNKPPEYIGTHSTAIIAHHDSLLAAVEVAMPLKFELGKKSGSLKANARGAQPFEGVEQKSVFSAHPKICPRTGDMFFFSTTPRLHFPPAVGFNQVSREGKLLKSLKIPIFDSAGTSPGWVHDLWLTENFAVFFDASLRSDGKERQRGGKYFSWRPEDNMRLGVVPRNATEAIVDEMVWCDTGSPGHIWHILNGWETPTDDGTIHMSLFAPKFDEYLDTIPIHLPEEPPSRLTHWDLKVNFDTKTCIVNETKLRDEIVERPSTNLRFHGSPRAKWAFLRSEGTEASAAMGGTVLKVDLTTGELAAEFVCEGKEPCVTGEALFVPKNSEFNDYYPYVGSGGVSETEVEDDGYLMDFVYYPRRNTSELVIWDASSSGLVSPIARVELPERVPYGVHAWFVPPRLYSPSF